MRGLTVITVYLHGVILLIVAILLNILAEHFRLLTWYDYVLDMQLAGIVGATRDLDWQSAVFLYLAYPAVLGMVMALLVKDE